MKYDQAEDSESDEESNINDRIQNDSSSKSYQFNNDKWVPVLRRNTILHKEITKVKNFKISSSKRKSQM